MRGTGGKGRKPGGRPIRVTHARNWTQISLFAAAAVVALAIVTFAVYALVSRPDPSKWKEVIPQAADTIKNVTVLNKQIVVAYMQDAKRIPETAERTVPHPVLRPAVAAWPVRPRASEPACSKEPVAGSQTSAEE